MRRLLPTTTTARRVLRGEDPLGNGMEAVITLVVFLAGGWLLDRWLGTAPWLMITLFLLSAVGLFVKIKARYTQRMEYLEAERAATRMGARSGIAGDVAGGDDPGHDVARHRRDASAAGMMGP